MLLLAQFILFVGVGAVIPVMPIYGKEVFGLSSAANGAIIGAPAIALVVLARPAGGFADQARKPAMMIGMAVIILSDLCTATATTLPALLLGRLGLGAGRCVSECGERGYLADLASRAPASRGEIAAAQQAVSALGIAVGSPLGGLAVEHFGARAAYLCVALAALVTLSTYTALAETLGADDETAAAEAEADMASDEEADAGYLRSTVAPKAVTMAATAATAAKVKAVASTAAEASAIATAPEASGGGGGAASWGSLVREDTWRGLAACEAGLRVGYAAKVTAVPLLAAATLPGGALAAGSLLSAAALSGLVGAPFGGWLADRQGARFVAIGAAATSGLSLLLVPLALSAPLEALGEHPNGIAFASLIVLWSFGVAALGPALTAVAQELAPKGAEATALAFPRAVGDGAYIVAPFALGLIGDWNPDVAGIECGVAGAAGLSGSVALALLAGRRPGA